VPQSHRERERESIEIVEKRKYCNEETRFALLWLAVLLHSDTGKEKKNCGVR
jgi:hypothetical protein